MITMELKQAQLITARWNCLKDQRDHMSTKEITSWTYAFIENLYCDSELNEDLYREHDHIMLVATALGITKGDPGHQLPVTDSVRLANAHEGIKELTEFLERSPNRVPRLGKELADLLDMIPNTDGTYNTMMGNKNPSGLVFTVLEWVTNKIEGIWNNE